MRISRITVKNLFGIFDHTIPLKLEDRITIIHGPNGFGKTIMLRMVNGLFNKNYSELQNIPFDQFDILFQDNSLLKVNKLFEEKKSLKHKKEIRKESNTPKLQIEYSNSTKDKLRSCYLDSFPDEIPINFPPGIIEEMIPNLSRTGSKLWIDTYTGQSFNIREVLNRYGHLLPFKIPGFEKEEEWWQKLQGSVDIHLIESQRLYNIPENIINHKRRSQMRPSVMEYSEELAETIQQKLAESAALSQSLDRTFPARLVEQMGHSKLAENDLREKLGLLEKERTRLKDAGLLDKEDDMGFLPREEIGSNTKDVLTVYVQDVEKKLSVFNEIAKKIDLFKTIINKRFLYKKIKISKEEGFSLDALNGKQLPLTKLSSGEQHELVLLYQLLFKVKPDALILIDEPELSLHVAWQKQFLKDLQEITKISSFDVLIATHSPQIIHDRWDLTVDLKGPEE